MNFKAHNLVIDVQPHRHDSDGTVHLLRAFTKELEQLLIELKCFVNFFFFFFSILFGDNRVVCFGGPKTQ